MEIGHIFRQLPAYLGMSNVSCDTGDNGDCFPGAHMPLEALGKIQYIVVLQA